MHLEAGSSSFWNVPLHHHLHSLMTIQKVYFTSSFMVIKAKDYGNIQPLHIGMRHDWKDSDNWDGQRALYKSVLPSLLSPYCVLPKHPALD